MASYSVVLTDGAHLGLTGTPTAVLSVTNADGPKLSDTQTPIMHYHPVVTGAVTITGLMIVTFPVTLTQGVTLTGVDAGVRQTFGLSADHILVRATDGEVAIYHLSPAEAVRIAAAWQTGEPVAVADAVHVASRIVVAFGATVLERLKFASVLTVLAKYGMTISELVAISPALGRMLGGVMIETLRMAGVPTVTYQAVTTTQEHATIGAALGNSLLMSMTMADTVSFTDVELMQMIYRGDALLDGVVITAGYVSPSGEFTTWSINTRTNAVTEYQNWAFNSFAKIGRKYVGANRNGLYELDGVDDDGVSIPTYVASGLFQLNGSRYTAFKAAYLGMRVETDEQMFLKLVDGRGNEFVYAVQPENMHSTRVNFGKGLRSRYFGWALQTVAADYDLESVVFVPLFSQRRVG
jgi:hypothetical protein